MKVILKFVALVAVTVLCTWGGFLIGIATLPKVEVISGFPAFHCGKDAMCDLESYSWEQQDKGARGVIDDIRKYNIESVSVQGEAESLKDFVARQPKPLRHRMMLFRNSPQKQGDYLNPLVLKNAEDVILMGGTFN